MTKIFKRKNITSVIVLAIFFLLTSSVYAEKSILKVIDKNANIRDKAGIVIEEKNEEIKKEKIETKEQEQKQEVKEEEKVTEVKEAEVIKTKTSRQRFFIGLSINSFYPSNSEFKTIYKESVMIPEVSVGFFLLEKLYFFGGYEFYKVEGKTPQWDLNSEMDQKILSFGAGYFIDLSEKLGLSAELGMVSISYTEKLIDFELENKSSCTGFRLGSKLQYKISSLIGFNLSLGYTIIKDEIDDISTDFGGLRLGIGAKISF